MCSNVVYAVTCIRLRMTVTTKLDHTIYSAVVSAVHQIDFQYLFKYIYYDQTNFSSSFGVSPAMWN